MTDCIFCKIVSGDIPSTKVYEDELYLGFMDIQPANKGHLLVVPKGHYETYTDAPEEVVAGLAAVAQRVAKGIDAALQPDGYNVLMNNRKAANQLVPHIHFHVIPRLEGDKHGAQFSEHITYEEGEMEDVANKIKEKI